MNLEWKGYQRPSCMLVSCPPFSQPDTPPAAPWTYACYLSWCRPKEIHCQFVSSSLYLICKKNIDSYLGIGCSMCSQDAACAHTIGCSMCSVGTIVMHRWRIQLCHCGVSAQNLCLLPKLLLTVTLARIGPICQNCDIGYMLQSLFLRFVFVTQHLLFMGPRKAI